MTMSAEVIMATASPDTARQAAWRAKNPERSRATHRRNISDLRARNMTDLRALKLLRGCFDCGYNESVDALEFDHRPGEVTSAGVAAYASSSNRLIEEVAKCDVVCANCHSIRTMSRRRS